MFHVKQLFGFLYIYWYTYYCYIYQDRTYLTPKTPKPEVPEGLRTIVRDVEILNQTAGTKKPPALESWRLYPNNSN